MGLLLPLAAAKQCQSLGAQPLLSPQTLQSPVSTQPHSVMPPSCTSSVTAAQGHPALTEAGLPIALPTAPVQGFDQHSQEPSTPPATKRAPGPPPPETKWASSKTTPQTQATRGMAAPLTQPLWGMTPPPTQPSWVSLENASPEDPGDATSGSKAAVLSTLPHWNWSWPWNIYLQWTQGIPAEKDRTVISLWNTAISPPSVHCQQHSPILCASGKR